ncbi:MAG: hypothetical protein JNL11_04300 [Bdellovibrionaceae bacterium]|nr:hypothetical protein [Pseudobdellovibrionaceae bacterium]
MDLQEDKVKRQRSGILPPSRVFTASYDNVWRAALTVLKYSITEQNQETGHIETDYVKPSDGGWTRPDGGTNISAGMRYKISMSLVRVQTKNGSVGVKVTVDKKIERVRDFFSDPEPIDSDHLEEKALLYRIDRELVIEETLRKANPEVENNI